MTKTQTRVETTGGSKADGLQDLKPADNPSPSVPSLPEENQPLDAPTSPGNGVNEDGDREEAIFAHADEGTLSTGPGAFNVPGVYSPVSDDVESPSIIPNGQSSITSRQQGVENHEEPLPMLQATLVEEQALQVEPRGEDSDRQAAGESSAARQSDTSTPLVTATKLSWRKWHYFLALVVVLAVVGGVVVALSLQRRDGNGTNESVANDDLSAAPNVKKTPPPPKLPPSLQRIRERGYLICFSVIGNPFDPTRESCLGCDLVSLRDDAMSQVLFNALPNNRRLNHYVCDLSFS